MDRPSLPVKWSRPALDGLIEIVRYLADKDPHAADRLVNRIQERAATLGTTPLQGRPSPRFEGLRELVVGNTPYILFYRITATRIEIVRIHHSHRQWPPEP